MATQRIMLCAGRPSMASQAIRALANSQIGIRFSSTAPATVVQGSFWKSLIPKPLRKKNVGRKKTLKNQEWNPATYFIVMFLLIGSMSIQMIALRNQTERYMRRSNVRIEQLREVVKRIQNGEDVDVDKILGTGDAQKEADWDELLQAIERDETTPKAPKAEQAKATPLQPTPVDLSTSQSQQSISAQSTPDSSPAKAKPTSFGNFY